MKPFHLQVWLDPRAVALTCQWFGPSAIHAAGSAHHALGPGAGTTLVPDPYLIDLQPLLAEIAAGTISDTDDFQAADEFLMLRDLLADEDFEQLCETLYHFLWREAQQGIALEGGQRGADGTIWIDPDRRLVRVWFATDLYRSRKMTRPYSRKQSHPKSAFFPKQGARLSGAPWKKEAPGVHAH